MKKRIASFGICLLFICSVMIVKVDASNYTDTVYTYSFSNYCPYQGWNTETREKQDTTSSYMKCEQSAGKTYTAWVSAANSSGAILPINVGSPSYVFSAGTTRYLVNYVRESGYSYAMISAYPNSSGYYTVSGLWSPDSI